MIECTGKYSKCQPCLGRCHRQSSKELDFRYPSLLTSETRRLITQYTLHRNNFTVILIVERRSRKIVLASRKMEVSEAHRLLGQSG